MPEPITSTTISKYLVMGLLSAFGGVTHTLVEKRAGRVTSFFDGLALAFISGFAGVMWGLIALRYFPHDVVLVAFASGMGGFASLEGMALLLNLIRKVINKDKE